jgi:ankyrin repeat protein
VPASLPRKPPLAIAAAMRGDTAILRMLIAAGLDVNERDANGWTAVRFARSGQARRMSRGRGAPADSNAIVAMLETAGASDVAGVRSDALFDAVLKKDSARVQAALAARANPNAPNERGVPPLAYAASGGHLGIVTMLIGAGAAVNSNPQNDATPLINAIEGGHVNIVKALLAAGARANQADRIRRTPLQVASNRNRPEIAALLLDAGAPVDSLALPYAALGGDTTLVRLLLAFGANPNAGRGHALSEATRGCYRNDNTDVIRALLDGGADPKVHGDYSALHRAAGLCEPEVVRLLLARGADPNARDMSGVTPLISAAVAGRLETVRLLIAAHADVSARDSSGRSVLTHAGRHPDVQQELRRAGAR